MCRYLDMVWPMYSSKATGTNLIIIHIRSQDGIWVEDYSLFQLPPRNTWVYFQLLF